MLAGQFFFLFFYDFHDRTLLQRKIRYENYLQKTHSNTFFMTVKILYSTLLFSFLLFSNTFAQEVADKAKEAVLLDRMAFSACGCIGKLNILSRNLPQNEADKLVQECFAGAFMPEMNNIADIYGKVVLNEKSAERNKILFELGKKTGLRMFEQQCSAFIEYTKKYGNKEWQDMPTAQIIGKLKGTGQDLAPHILTEENQKTEKYYLISAHANRLKDVLSLEALKDKVVQITFDYLFLYNPADKKYEKVKVLTSLTAK